nr:MAG TPA: hypothetical protein [Caudoviricetes sp.]
MERSRAVHINHSTLSIKVNDLMEKSGGHIYKK